MIFLVAFLGNHLARVGEKKNVFVSLPNTESLCSYCEPEIKEEDTDF